MTLTPRRPGFKARGCVKQEQQSWESLLWRCVSSAFILISPPLDPASTDVRKKRTR